MGAIKQIIGSFGDIGGEIIRETAKVPGDVAGKALESLGGKSGKTKGSQQKSKSTVSQGEETLNKVTKTTDEKVKKAISRKALEELVGYGKPQKEPTEWEKKKMEAEQKKKMEAEQKKKEEQKALPKVPTKARRGDLYGLQAKIAGSEIAKNVRAE